ncbi:MAG TPA: hypothetical protein VHY79_07110 [Rhizomicrobium sp.]|jgi:hypothetical protein|nr:hypothetical protein [Rhizomicrobium sp.]
MTKPLLHRLPSEGGTTIPYPVIKADPLDRTFLKLAEAAFEEWNNPEDETAFDDL